MSLSLFPVWMGCVRESELARVYIASPCIHASLSPPLLAGGGGGGVLHSSPLDVFF